MPLRKAFIITRPTTDARRVSPRGDTSASTVSTTSRKTSLRLYFNPGARHPTAPVTCSVAAAAWAARLAEAEADSPPRPPPLTRPPTRPRWKMNSFNTAGSVSWGTPPSTTSSNSSSTSTKLERRAASVHSPPQYARTAPTVRVSRARPSMAFALDPRGARAMA